MRARWNAVRLQKQISVCISDVSLFRKGTASSIDASTSLTVPSVLVSSQLLKAKFSRDLLSNDAADQSIILGNSKLLFL